MDFNYTAEDEGFRTEFRAWLEHNLRYATPMREPLADELAGDWEARITWHRTLNEGGWMAINWPEESGGAGAALLPNHVPHPTPGRACAQDPFHRPRLPPPT